MSMVKVRQKIEREIAAAFIDAALDAGFSITVDDGTVCSEEGDYPVKQSRDGKEILAGMFSVDDEHLLVIDSEGKQVGWVYFVYGNEGWEVVNDYSANRITEALMVRPNEISESYQ